MVNQGVESVYSNAAIYNVAVFGLDERVSGGPSRADTIIIASFNFKDNKIKLLSIMRDTYVQIPGDNLAKINSAHSSGGAQLALAAINHNFDMAIDSHVSFDFQAIADIVDAIGGIEMTIDKKVVADMNHTITTTNRILGHINNSQHVAEGTQVLDGRQAVAYARMRNTGNADFDRTARQREVALAIFKKAKGELSPSVVNKLVEACQGNCSTSLSNTRMARICLAVAGGMEIDGMQALSGNVLAKNVRGSAVLLPNSLEDMAIEMHSFLYPGKVYSPSGELVEISESLAKFK